MRIAQYSKKWSYKMALKACSSALIFALTFSAPLQAIAGSQQSAQDSSGSKNDKAATLSQVVSVISIAAGALSMAQGLQELSCCSNGCNTGAGSSAGAAKAANDANAANAAKQVNQNRATMKRFPESASLEKCRSQVRMPFSFFLAPFMTQKVQASGCADAMMAMATGGLMMAMGLMGMMAAKNASKNAGISKTNAANLASTGSSNLNGVGSSQGIKIDPALLRNGQANAVMTDFEKKFGIPRDDFAKAINSGADPRDLLSKAPRNAMSEADMNKAMHSGDLLSSAQKSAAMNGLAGVQKDLLAKLDDTYSSGGGGGGYRSPSSLKSSLASAVEPVAEAAKPEENPTAMPLSDDLKAALAAKEQQDRLEGLTGLSIFQVVHNKYQEKLNMIYGQGSSSGVANDQGF